MLGKQKCKILKEIRQRIADENDIPYVTRECTHKGECRGTCPSCESELRYLERELAARQSLGKRVAVAALCAGLAFSSVGCDLKNDDEAKIRHTTGRVAPRRTPAPEPEPTPEYVIDGYVPYDEPEPDPVTATVPPEISTPPYYYGHEITGTPPPTMPPETDPPSRFTRDIEGMPTLPPEGWNG